MVPVSNEITMFNIDDNGNPTTPHEMKNTTLAWEAFLKAYF